MTSELFRRWYGFDLGIAGRSFPQTLRVVTGKARSGAAVGRSAIEGNLFCPRSYRQETSDISAPWWSRTLAAACDTSSPTSPSNAAPRDPHRQQHRHPHQRYELHQLQAITSHHLHPGATRMTRTTTTKQRHRCTHRRRRQHGAMQTAACLRSTREIRSAI